MKPVSTLGGDMSGPVMLSRGKVDGRQYQAYKENYQLDEEIRKLKRELERIMRNAPEKNSRWRKLYERHIDVAMKQAFARLETLGIKDNPKVNQEIERLRKEILGE